MKSNPSYNAKALKFLEMKKGEKMIKKKKKKKRD